MFQVIIIIFILIWILQKSNLQLSLLPSVIAGFPPALLPIAASEQRRSPFFILFIDKLQGSTTQRRISILFQGHSSVAALTGKHTNFLLDTLQRI